MARGTIDALLLAAAASCLTARPAPAAEVHWLDGYDHAVLAAKKQRRPLLVFVSMRGCRYCRQMQNVTFRDAALTAQLNRSFVAVLLEGREARKLVRVMRIDRFPTTLLATPDRTVRKRLQGYVGPAALRRALDEVTALARPSP